MRINFVGNNHAGVVGEVGDENHIVRELRDLGHEVNFIPRDIWKAHCDGYEHQPDWEQYLKDLKADINIICKWHHFTESKYVDLLGIASGAPVFYWVWDYMADDPNENFNTVMGKACDVYLTNEGGAITFYKLKGIPAYYFPFDCADNKIPTFKEKKIYDVVFFGNHFGKGDRLDWLKGVKDKIPLKIFSFNYENWRKDGFDASPAVYGEEFNQVVAASKICLQFSVNDHSWGYWSNRVGKILLSGGFLLARYAPGMELFLRDGAEYFSSPEELVEKVDHFLLAEEERDIVSKRGSEIAERFSSQSRVKELSIFIERYLKGAFNG